MQLFTPDPYPEAFSTQYSYDKAGNILTLKRNGFVGLDQNNDPLFVPIDDLAYSYANTISSELTKIEDNLEDVNHLPFGVNAPPENPWSYSIDGSGNILSGGLNSFTYNPLNLPETMDSPGGSSTQEYISSGQKYKKITENGVDSETRYYLGGVEWVDSIPVTYFFGDGRIVWEKSGDTLLSWPQYRITDHLGNSMVFFEDKNDDGLLVTELQTLNPDSLDVKQRLWYYPFGMQMEGIGQDSTAPAQAYRYNGKELDEATGLYDYGARYYDPAIARFPSIDRFAEKFAWQSPYVYAGNNPIKFIDVNGDSLKLNFIGAYAQHSKNLLSGMINRNLEGQFRVIYRDVTYDKDNEIASGNLTIIPTAGGGDLDKMTLNGQEFYRELTEIAHEEGTLTEINVDYANPSVHTGNFGSETIDVADMLQFNESLTDLGGTQGGKFIHEVREQYSKQVLGERNFNTAHRMAIQSENNVNLSVRKDRGAVQTYSMGGRTVSNKIVFEKRNVINVIKN